MPNLKRYDGATCPKCGGPVQIIRSLQTVSNTLGYQDVQCVHCGTEYTESWAATMLTELDDAGNQVADIPVEV